MMTVAAMQSEHLRGLLLSALIFSPILGAAASINFYSMEDYRGPERGFEVTLTDLIALSLVAEMLLKRSRQVSWLPFNSLFMAVFFLVACVATVLAPVPVFGAFALFKFLRIYLVFWCVVNCLKTGVDRQYVWLGFVGIGLVLMVLALKQKYIDGLYRINGPFDHSNSIPLFVNLIMPALLIWGLCDRAMSKWRVAISVVAALGMTFAVVATFSRAGTALAGLCLVGGLVLVNLRSRSVRVTATSALVALALVAGAAKAAASFIDRMLNAPEASEHAREEFNDAARMMVADRPYFGIGLNNFSHVLTSVGRYRENLVVMSNEEQAGVCHHIYWLMTAETGYVGLTAFVLMIGRFAWLALRRSYGSRSVEGLALFGFFLGFCALHASGTLEWAFRITPVTYMFGIAAAMTVSFATVVAKQRAQSRVLVRSRSSSLPAPRWATS